MVQQKDTAIAKQQRRAMAQLLEVCLVALFIISFQDLMLAFSKEKRSRHVSESRTSFVPILTPSYMKC